MKTILFENKEEYLKSKIRWASYFNKEARNLKMDSYGYKARKLKAAHFILYAIMRGKDPFIAIRGCSNETYNECATLLQSTWFYNAAITKEAFNLNAEQFELIRAEACKLISNTPKSQIIRQEKVPITEEQLQSCLA